MKKVLLIEDDRYLRRAAETALRQRGVAVLSAADGAEGLRLATTEAPDLILLDLLLPKMNGLDILRELRGRPGTRDVRVLVLSNSSRQSDIDQLRALGIIEYLVKANLSLHELGDRVERLLGDEP